MTHYTNFERLEITTTVLSLPNEAATQALALSLAVAAHELMRTQLPPNGLTLHLIGELGVGKTTFVRYFLNTLGVSGRIKSPTYGLAESYEFAPNMQAWHFDFYRLKCPEEWSESGFAEAWSQPFIRLVEWPENAGADLPQANLNLQLAWPDVSNEIHNPMNEISTSRIATLVAVNALGEIWLNDSRNEIQQ